jgi:catechol 2,3-dioxygenase-like lactoylglutathione lyase family enzyme
MIAYKRFDHVYISVPAGREHDAHLFYTHVMGFTPTTRSSVLNASKGYWYQLPGMELHIGTEAGIPLLKQHFAMEVANLQSARKHLTDNGILINEEIAIPGRNRFTFQDPFGNRIELLEYPQTP